MHRILALALGLLLAAPAAADDATPDCVDAVIVAKLVRENPTDLPDAGPDEIVIRWPWVLTFEVEEVLAGRLSRDTITVVASMHTGFNPEIRHHLLFLRKGERGRFRLVAHEYKVVQDRRGRFVVPVAEPIGSDWLEPEGWVPGDYEKHLRPLRYSPRDAWWLDEPYSDPADADPAWAYVKNGSLVAKRGLPLDDLKSSLAARACRQ